AGGAGALPERARLLRGAHAAVPTPGGPDPREAVAQRDAGRPRRPAGLRGEAWAPAGPGTLRTASITLCSDMMAPFPCRPAPGVRAPPAMWGWHHPEGMDRWPIRKVTKNRQNAVYRYATCFFRGGSERSARAREGVGPVVAGAHRAGGGYAPGSTLAALALARGQGADMAEIDVRSTRDGELV